MSIQADTVKQVANLARLDIDDEALPVMTGQLVRILDLMTRLDRLPTDAVQPMTHAVELAIPQRPDRVVNGDQRDLLLSGAPDSEQGHFRVPKIIE